MPEYRTLRGKSERKEKKNMGTISLVEFPRKRQRRAEKQATVKISSQGGRRLMSRGKCHERLRALHLFKYTNPCDIAGRPGTKIQS